MRVVIEIRNGPHHSDTVTKADVQRNMDALTRAAKHASAVDMQLLLDTRSILEGIQQQLK